MEKLFNLFETKIEKNIIKRRELFKNLIELLKTDFAETHSCQSESDVYWWEKRSLEHEKEIKEYKEKMFKLLNDLRKINNGFENYWFAGTIRSRIFKLKLRQYTRNRKEKSKEIS